MGDTNVKKREEWSQSDRKVNMTQGSTYSPLPSIGEAPPQISEVGNATVVTKYVGIDNGRAADAGDGGLPSFPSDGASSCGIVRRRARVSFSSDSPSSVRGRFVSFVGR